MTEATDIFKLQQALLINATDRIKLILSKKYGAEIPHSTHKINEYKEIVSICLRENINVNQARSNYSTLLHFVAKNLDRETFRHVLTNSKDFDINALNLNTYMSLLHFVIREGKGNLVQDLLEFGADVNIKNQLKQTPLFCATDLREKEIIEILLKAGVDINAKDSNCRTAINFLFNRPKVNSFIYWEIIQLFCAYGFTLDFKNKGGNLMLHDACGLGLFKEVQFLLKHGADLFFEHNSNTLLHEAIYGKNFDLVDFLLRNGLNINAENEDKETPFYLLSYYVRNKYSDSRSIFRKIKQTVDMIEFLADNGADVNIQNEEEYTTVHQSIFYQVNDIMECLLELNVNYRTNDVFNHYHFSFVNDNFDQIEILELFTAFLATRENVITEYIEDTPEGEFEWVEPYFEQCKFEVNQMRRTYICENSTVSYFDLLSKDLMKVSIFCRNEKIILALESRLYEEEFPAYKFFLDKRIKRAQLVKHCMEAYSCFLSGFFQKSLPAVVMDQIFSFLKVGDVRNFGRALRVFPKAFKEENIS